MANTQSMDKLLRSCRRGNRRAQQEVYKRYHQAMYNTACRIVGDEWEAEDVMQEAFLDAFTKLDLYRGEASFGSWLKRIVINRCLNHLKARKRRPMEIPLNDEAYIETDDSPPPGPEIRPSIMSEAIQALPSGYRTILSLYLLEGYDHQEIAGIMSISPGTSRSQFARAKDRLRKIIIDKQNTFSS